MAPSRHKADTMPDSIRRRTLKLIGMSASVGLMLPRSAFAQDTSTLIGDGDICVLTPGTTEGPYYFDPGLERRDITEGKPGARLDLALQIVDSQCRPIEGARADIWHCDAGGLYSNYAGQGDDRSTSTRGETFLRGTQFSDENGVAHFDTIYPGWYPGRTPHIHFMIYLDQKKALTGQLFFPDEVSVALYQSRAPYNERPNPNVLNTNDGIARRAGSAAMAQIAQMDTGFDASLVIGVAE